MKNPGTLLTFLQPRTLKSFSAIDMNRWSGRWDLEFEPGDVFMVLFELRDLVKDGHDTVVLSKHGLARVTRYTWVVIPNSYEQIDT